MNLNIKLRIAHKNISVKSDIEKGQEIFNSNMRSFVDKSESMCNEMERIIKSLPYSNFNNNILNDICSLQNLACRYQTIFEFIDSGYANMSFYEQSGKSRIKEETILKLASPKD